MDASLPLAGKAALVTGGSSGIGLAIVRALASAGASVIMNDIHSRGETAAQTLRDAGQRVHFLQADASNEDGIKSMLAGCGRELGRLDIVVNNAARSSRERVPFEQQGLEGWDADHDIMVKGYMQVAQAAAPYLKAAGGGAIVNISSVLARTVSQEPCGYHVAKAGVEQLTRYLAYALGPQHIRVNAVAPGLVDRDVGPKLSDDPVNRAVIGTSVPLGRAATASDIAGVVVFLCSAAAAYVTGQIIAVDGGLSVSEPFGAGRRAYYQAQDPDKKSR